MHIGVMVVLQMSTNTIGIRHYPERPRNSGGAVIHRWAHRRIRALVRLVRTAEREDTNTAGIQRSKHVIHDALLFGKRYVPDAVPCADEVVCFWNSPAADISVIKGELWMVGFGQLDHSGRDIKALGLKAVLHQQFKNTTAASTAQVECRTLFPGKGKGALMLGYAVLLVKLVASPALGELVVAFCDCIRLHELAWVNSGRVRQALVVVRRKA